MIIADTKAGKASWVLVQNAGRLQLGEYEALRTDE